MSETSTIIFICQLISLTALTIGAVLDWRFRFIYDWTWGMILLPGVVTLTLLIMDAGWSSNYWIIHTTALVFALILVVVFWFFGLWGSGDSLSYFSVSIAFIIPASAWHNIENLHWPGSFSTILYFIPLIVLTVMFQGIINLRRRRSFWQEIARKFGWKNTLGLIFFGKKVNPQEITLEGLFLTYMIITKTKMDDNSNKKSFWKVAIFEDQPFFSSFDGDKISQEEMKKRLNEQEIVQVWAQRGLPFVSVLWLGTVLFWVFGFPLKI